MALAAAGFCIYHLVILEQGYGKSAIILLEKQKYSSRQRSPPPLSHRNFGRKTLVLHFGCLLDLLSHLKYVSRSLLFFFNPSRISSKGSLALTMWLRSTRCPTPITCRTWQPPTLPRRGWLVFRSRTMEGHHR